MLMSKYHPDFVTVTCLNWIPVLASREHKEIVINSLRFLVKEGRVRVSAFVLMDTHFHLIWQVMGEHKRENVQRDFLRFTAQQMLKNLPPLLVFFTNKPHQATPSNLHDHFIN